MVTEKASKKFQKSKKKIEKEEVDTREKKSIHVFEVPIIKVDGYSTPDEAFAPRFKAMNNIHNAMVKELQRRIDLLNRDKEYRALRSKYIRLKADKKRAKEAKDISKQLETIRTKYDLRGNYSLNKFVAKQQNKYENFLCSKQTYKESQRVWAGADAVLFGNGKQLHYQKYKECLSISQSNDTNGIRLKKGCKYTYTFGRLSKNPLVFHVKKSRMDMSNEYTFDALSTETGSNTIKYYEIKRRMFKSGWRYYLVFVLEGNAPRKIHDIDLATNGTGGIDLGTSTIAFASTNNLILERLAPDAIKYEKKISILQRKRDRLNRALNPDYFDEDGCCIRRKPGEIRNWKSSNEMKRIDREIATLHRKKSEYVKNCHGQLANKIVKSTPAVFYEAVSVTGWAKRSKNPTEKSDKDVTVTKKDGTKKTYKKNKKKKRFGHSVGMHSPGLCATLIEQKCEKYDRKFEKIHTETFRASQLHHDTGEYIKPKLNERFKTIDGKIVQRDLYAAFLMSNSDETLDKPDFNKCSSNFDNFVKMENKLIERMKKEGISYKQCFGF